MKDPARFVLGSLLVSAAGTAIALSTFSYNPFGAAAGVLMFAAAYSVMERSGSLKEIFPEPVYTKVLLSYRSIYIALMAVGALSIGQGLVIGAKATQTLALSEMAACGVLVISGLMVVHESYFRGFMV